LLSISDTNIQDVSSLIYECGYDVAFLVPTPTGMSKGILDAHKSINSLLKRSGVHDYELQKQGSENKIVINSTYLTKEDSFNVKVSLYRPNAKKGDPRIWIYGLKKLANIKNLLALIVVEQHLYIVNCSIAEDLEIALKFGLPKLKKERSSIAQELLDKLIVISKKGFINTIRKGDTGVGITLENQLGIIENSSTNPDYKGIEIKSARVDQTRRQRNRSVLFSKVPKWDLSPVHTAEELVQKRGYIDSDGLMALRQTISGHRINKQGLYLDIDYANDYLRQVFSDSGLCINPEHDTTWIIADLKAALIKKHKETFWVKAKHNNNRENESFHYIEVEHTSNPHIERLENLLETGLITLDYTLHLKDNGTTRDHGYIFKLKQNSKTALFPKPAIYDLENFN